MVMVPFGAVMMTALLPGQLSKTWLRNLAAAAAAVVAFAIAGYLPLQGQRTGGCQFHYALLGLTRDRDMNVQSPIMRSAITFSDTFVDLKAGDYANRVMAMEPPILCGPTYDEATGDLFFRIAADFPGGLRHPRIRLGADDPARRIAARTASAVVGGVPGVSRLARTLDRVLSTVAPLIPLAAIGAVAVAWSVAPRLGIALTAFVLFLTGYPAIQFETRHWFHLRFLSLWMVLALWAAWRHGRGKWTAVAIRRGLVPAAATHWSNGAGVVDASYRPETGARSVVGAYLAASLESLQVSSNEAGLAVDWQPAFFGHESSRRASDMLAVTVAPQGCGADGPVDLVFRYSGAAHQPQHDEQVRVERQAAGPTTVFFPVFSLSEFDRTLLRFTGVEVHGPARSTA